MIQIKASNFYENILVINRVYRFKNPTVIIKTWYGIKVISGGTYRFFTFDKIIKKALLESLNLNIINPKIKREAPKLKKGVIDAQK
jgi:hypothetical protein